MASSRTFGPTKFFLQGSGLAQLRLIKLARACRRHPVLVEQNGALTLAKRPKMSHPRVCKTRWLFSVRTGEEFECEVQV
jgi:hypothetical protein